MIDPNNHDAEPALPSEPLFVESGNTGPSPTKATESLNGAPAQPLWGLLLPPANAGELGRLGDYHVVRELGRGGMGVVFEARDPQLNRLVALKVMRPDMHASPNAVERFLREARAAATVKHDHIVTIYQVGQDRGIPFMVLEYLHGESLEARLKCQGSLPSSEVARIGQETAMGLAAAHEHGLIHRDIKPANIWLESPKSRVKILDFGLARVSQDDIRLTGSGAIVGTPAYMSPEQANGEPLDQRTDLFSLGVVLYRMATGEPPFKGNATLTLLAQLATHSPVAPHVLNPSVPELLSHIIMQLLAKNPAQRLPSATVVAEALMPLTNSLAVAANGAEVPPEANREAIQPLSQSTTISHPALQESLKHTNRVRRHRPIRVLLLSVCGLLLFVAVAWPLLARLLNQKRMDQPHDTGTLTNNNERDHNSWSRIVLPLQRVGPSPLDYLDPANIPIGERFPWQPKELVAVVGTHAQRHWGSVWKIVFSPTGDQVVSWGTDGLRLWDVKTMQEIGWLARGERLNGHALAYSPDGTRMGYYRPNPDDFVIYDVTARPPKEVAVISRVPVRQPFFADGQHVLMCNQNTTPPCYEIWDIRGTKPMLVKKMAEQRVDHTAIAAGVNRFIRVSPTEDKMFVATLTDCSRELPTSKDVRIASPHWAVSADGRWFVASEPTRSQVRVYDISEGQWDEQASFAVGQDGEQAVQLRFLPSSSDELFYCDGTMSRGSVRHLRSGKVRTLTQQRWLYYDAFAFDPTLQHLIQRGPDWYPRLDFQAITADGVVSLRNPTGISVVQGLSPVSARLLTWESRQKPPQLWRLDGPQPSAISINQASKDYLLPPNCVRPDGHVVAMVEHLDRLALIDPSKGDAVEPTIIPGNVVAPKSRYTLSPTGRHLLICPAEGDTRPQVFDLSKTPPERLFAFPDAPTEDNDFGDPLYSPTEQFAVANLTLYDLRGAKPKAVGTLDTSNVSFALDQPLIVGCYNDGTIKVFDYSDGSISATNTILLQPFVSAVTGAIALPNSQTLLASDTDGHVRFIQMRTGVVEQEWSQWPGGARFMLAPDGRHVYAQNANGTCYILRMTINGKQSPVGSK